MKILSYNLCISWLTDKHDKLKWKKRFKNFQSLIKQEDPDIVGLQELTPIQAYDIAIKLKKYKLLLLFQTPAKDSITGLICDAIGIEKLAKKTDCWIGTAFIGIMIKKEKEKVKILKMGRFWLNKNPYDFPIGDNKDKKDIGFGNKKHIEQYYGFKLK